jgi:hypothetical protein
MLYIIQRFLRSFSGTGTRTKCRSRHKTSTDRNQVIQYRHRKVLIMTFFRPVLTGPFQSVQVLCRDRHFVLVTVPLKDRKKRCKSFFRDHNNLVILKKKKKFKKKIIFFINISKNFTTRKIL